MIDGRDAIEELARINGDLLAAARRSFSSIGQAPGRHRAMLVLADGEGVLIDAIGDKRTLTDGMDIHLAVGGKWTEDVVGTNGIGTALWAGEPVFVHAAEHFCAGIKDWTCAGAPIPRSPGRTDHRRGRSLGAPGHLPAAQHRTGRGRRAQDRERDRRATGRGA
jgi:transcriptional regulator of acetoin/glycerol metabolism